MRRDSGTFQKYPLFSVVTICLNVETEIERTIYSVLNQTDCEVEYIIKDGKSSDNTNNRIKGIINKAEYKQHNIKHIIRKDNGIYSAMNQAIEECSGEWILFLNAGDFFYTNESISASFKNRESYKYDVIYGDAIARDNDGDGIWYSDMNLIKKKMPFCHQTCWIKRELLLKYKFNEKYRIAGDYDLILKLYEDKASFFNSGVIVSVYHLDGISSVYYRKRLKEHSRVRDVHGYSMKKSEYFFKYIEALIKEWIDNYYPTCIKKRFRKLYKIFFKRYGNVQNNVKNNSGD